MTRALALAALFCTACLPDFDRFTIGGDGSVDFATAGDGVITTPCATSVAAPSTSGCPSAHLLYAHGSNGTYVIDQVDFASNLTNHCGVSMTVTTNGTPGAMSMTSDYGVALAVGSQIAYASKTGTTNACRSFGDRLPIDLFLYGQSPLYMGVTLSPVSDGTISELALLDGITTATTDAWPFLSELTHATSSPVTGELVGSTSGRGQAGIMELSDTGQNSIAEPIQITATDWEFGTVTSLDDAPARVAWSATVNDAPALVTYTRGAGVAAHTCGPCTNLVSASPYYGDASSWLLLCAPATGAPGTIYLLNASSSACTPTQFTDVVSFAVSAVGMP